MDELPPSRTIGILGGMGPAATVEFMKRIVEQTPASDDADHLRMLVDNNPQVPSRIAALIERDGTDPLPVLKRMATGLEAAGADLLVMPCNTAHHYHERLAAAVGIPFLSIIEETADFLLREQPGASSIGFLASPAVQLTGVYEEHFRKRGLSIVYPAERDAGLLLDIIRDVKAGRIGAPQADALAEIAVNLSQHSDFALVACTELSLLSLPAIPSYGVADTLDILVAASIASAREPAVQPA